MSNNPDKIVQFWQELKRRKVVSVITVYAAAAFVILELVSIIVEPLRLPEWTLQFAIVFLCIGFIIAIILSWIYDIKPEGGIVKTEPAHRAKADDQPASSNSWKIASYISFVVIVGLIVLNIIPRTNRLKEIAILEKSIAVLPFTSLSDDPEKQYLADGVMDAILLHLSKIEDLRVMSRTSVEQYRVTEKKATEICEELDVGFVLEGSFRKYGDQARLIVQLIQSGKEDHAWAEQYDREWNDIFTVESAVAQSIAQELKAVITPEEKELIEKVPTTNLTAHDFYLRGRDEYFQYYLDNDDKPALERAEKQYHDALEYDSTYALAYTGLARIYWEKHYWETYFTEGFLDSVLILADVALYFDNQLADAYIVRGEYYVAKGLSKQAVKEFDIAIKFNPNDWKAYSEKGQLYVNDDLVKWIDNLHKAASINHGKEFPSLLRDIGWAYNNAGFKEKATFYSQEVLKLVGDSAEYYSSLSNSEWNHGNYEKVVEFGKKAYAMDSTNVFVLSTIGYSYIVLGQYEESLKYYKKWIEKLYALGDLYINGMHRVGYAYWKNGYKDEAGYYFNLQKKYSDDANELGRSYSRLLFSYYDLAGVYAFRGEKDKAFENLRIFNQIKRIPRWLLTHFEDDPLFENIRDEPEFQQIVRDVEAKYQAEHERVRQWLEENDML